MGVCFLCWQHSTWIVFDQWAWNNSSFFWQPMSSHVAKVTTWTNLVNLNSGFFDVSVHKYIPRQEGWIRRTMQGTNGLLFFYPPPCPDMNPFCLELGVRKKCFPFMWFLKPLPICLASVGSRSVGFLPSPTVRLDFRFQLVSRRGESRLHLYSTLWNLFRFKCLGRKVDWLSFLQYDRRLYQIFRIRWILIW